MAHSHSWKYHFCGLRCLWLGRDSKPFGSEHVETYLDEHITPGVSLQEKERLSQLQS